MSTGGWFGGWIAATTTSASYSVRFSQAQVPAVPLMRGPIFLGVTSALRGSAFYANDSQIYW